MSGDEVPDQRKVMEAYIADYESCTSEKLNFQFLDIRKDQIDLRESEEYSCSIGQRPDNFLRNRYRDILPYNTNRVQLEPTASNPEGYINASVITSDETPTVYIASQAPLPETVEDFWHMICQKKINVIVMLCKCVESFTPKCEMYWPKNVGETRTFGDFAVTFVKETVFNEFSHRSLVVKSEKYGTLETEQLHYTEWPDHGCPQGEKQVLQLIEQMCTLRTTDSPILIHCSAGCGRTGTVIALTIIRDLINQRTLKQLNVKELVSNLRRQRTSMVQTQSQYHLLRKCVAVYCKMALGIDTETKSPASSPVVPDDRPMAPGLSLHTELRKPPALPLKPPTQPPVPVEKKTSNPSSPAPPPPAITTPPVNTNPFLDPEPPRTNTNPFLEDVTSDSAELVVRL
uniref:protein-tyrosine-phosphatase n=1 Tax=Panagrellus redivivus TaxID=6233 RepID=A0A7E4W188_PANRE